MKHVLPVLTVVAAIIALWYAAAVGLNRAWVYDQAERAGVAPASGMALIAETWSQERPVLPAPHQVAVELKTTLAWPKLEAVFGLSRLGHAVGHAFWALPSARGWGFCWLSAFCTTVWT
jgi:hypothetical protein